MQEATYSFCTHHFGLEGLKANRLDSHAPVVTAFPVAATMLLQKAMQRQ